MITHQETEFQYGYFLVRAVFKDVIGMHDVNQMSYV